VWAEPDLDAAAEAMREVYERSGLVAARVAQARADVSPLQSGEPMAAFLRSRLAAATATGSVTAAAAGRTTRQ
jgi:hypothetical protein